MRSLNRLLRCFLLTWLFGFSAQATELEGFDQLVAAIDGRSEKRLYKLVGKSYELTYKQAGNFQLRLEPEVLFEVKKNGSNTFTATIVNPKAMWQKHGKEPFKIKWFIVELID